MINALRKKIDTIDSQILKLMAKRLGLAKNLGAEKKKKLLPVRDASRESQKLSHLSALAKKLALDSGFIQALFRKILAESRRVQRPSRR